MISTLLWYIEPDRGEKCAEISRAADGISAQYVYSDGKLCTQSRYSDKLCNYFDRRIMPRKTAMIKDNMYHEP